MFHVIVAAQAVAPTVGAPVNCKLSVDVNDCAASAFAPPSLVATAALAKMTSYVRVAPVSDLKKPAAKRTLKRSTIRFWILPILEIIAVLSFALLLLSYQ